MLTHLPACLPACLAGCLPTCTCIRLSGRQGVPQPRPPRLCMLLAVLTATQPEAAEVRGEDVATRGHKRSPCKPCGLQRPIIIGVLGLVSALAVALSLSSFLAGSIPCSPCLSSVCPSVRLCDCGSVCLCVCLSARLCVSVSVCVCLSVSVSVCRSLQKKEGERQRERQRERESERENERERETKGWMNIDMNGMQSIIWGCIRRTTRTRPHKMNDSLILAAARPNKFKIF